MGWLRKFLQLFGFGVGEAAKVAEAKAKGGDLGAAVQAAKSLDKLLNKVEKSK